MITFSVVKEPLGWSVRMGETMTTPFWSRTLAIREADCMAQAIRRHGECVEVIVDEAVTEPATRPLKPPRSAWDGSRSWMRR